MCRALPKRFVMHLPESLAHLGEVRYARLHPLPMTQLCPTRDLPSAPFFSTPRKHPHSPHSFTLLPSSSCCPSIFHPCSSFQGFTCLMQISTRTCDWLVDTLALRSHIGPALAPILADPAKVKVLHGADMDVLWLQVGPALISFAFENYKEGEHTNK
jgi:hypothetical protein